MRTLDNRDDIPVKLIGSWTTSIGPVQDQAGTSWQYLLCLLSLETVGPCGYV